jgi:16S rRNA (guanine(527)-N(7))-methyltransferase RsmG
LDWNAKVNLISRKDTANIWQAHILHSASIPILVNIPKGAAILDLGSGGGLPGIVIKILRPDLHMVCLDATRKKMDAVGDMVKQLGLTDCEVTWGRAEDIGKQKPHMSSYNVVVARAVAPLHQLAQWSRPFLHPDRNRPPTLAALKGGNLENETAQTRALHGVRSVRESALVFPGSEQIPGVDKKLVIVEFD